MTGAHLHWACKAMHRTLLLVSTMAALAAPCVGQAGTVDVTLQEPETRSDQDAINLGDFRDYKGRLFRLITEFRRYRTTVPDIEQIMGMPFRAYEKPNDNPGWIVGIAHGFRSLRMNHRVALYYDPMRLNRQRRWSTIRHIEFETNYYVNFAQGDPPMQMYEDPARCLTAAELEAKLRAASLPFEITPPSADDDRRFITVGQQDLLAPDGMSLMAVVRPKAPPGPGASGATPDIAQACIESVDIS